MVNNDVLRRLRYALHQTDAQCIALLASVGVQVTDWELLAYMTREDEPAFVACPDRVLSGFLDGFVLQRRGPRDPSTPAPPEGRLTNNLVLRKLRIALEFKEADMLEVLALGGMTISASELGALFRSPSHKHYRPCGDQLLRNFLAGLTIKLRG